MRKITYSVALSCLALVAGCASPDDVSDVHRIKRTEATAGTPFTQALFQEYQAYARAQSVVEGEWPDAAYFARKGLRAGEGEVVAPEEASAWKRIPADRIPALDAARARLLGYFANGAPARVPAAAARAQAKYDCWVDEEADLHPNTGCRAELLAIEPDLRKPEPVIQTIPDTKYRVTRYSVNFKVNSAELGPDALATLKAAATDQAGLGAHRVYVEGHADATGPSGRNDVLSRQRAAAVADKLAGLGVPPAAIAARALGEAGATADAKDRRVDIVVEHGAWGYGGHHSWGYGFHQRPVFVVNFAFNSAELSAEALNTLKEVVAAQADLKPAHVAIEGHTDGIGTAAANERISALRAQAVADALTKLGGKADTVSVKGFGASEGLAAGSGAEALNRRVEIIFDRW